MPNQSDPSPELEGQEFLFALPPAAEPERRPMLPKVPRYPIWTAQKARLIANYIRFFLYITKHGTYVDLFAGPQNARDLNTWAANLVLEVEPTWLRHFHLIELDAEKVRMLLELKEKYSDRGVTVHQGDCNKRIDDVLLRIGPREATFVLLDQRTFECHWETARKIAAHKPAPEHKIEQFYFLASGWLDRSLSALTKNSETADRWYGDDGWHGLMNMDSTLRALKFARRFTDELGYASALPWPITAENGRVMYHMIHATDHPEAPKQMARAYRQAWRETFSIPEPRRFPGMEWPDAE